VVRATLGSWMAQLETVMFALDEEATTTVMSDKALVTSEALEAASWSEARRLLVSQSLEAS
jgi:hypothetical protein